MAVGNKLSKNNETMSDSMAHSLTNFSKTKENLESYGISKPPMIPQKIRDMNTKK
jgi:nitrate reductase cytochrome c-type subunit